MRVRAAVAAALVVSAAVGISAGAGIASAGSAKPVAKGAVGAPAPAHAKARCHAKRATLAVARGDAYLTGGTSGEEHAYVCAYAGGGPVEIGQAGDPDASSEGGEGPIVSRLAFAGKFAAFVYTDEDGARYLQVIDLTDARASFTYSLGGGSLSGVPGEVSQAGQLQVGKIVLAPDASLAWTEKGAWSGGYDVFEHDLQGTTLVDHDISTAPHSLTLNGSTLHWRWYDGSHHEASLP